MMMPVEPPISSVSTTTIPSTAFSSSSSSPFTPHWNLYPKTYVAQKIDTSSSSSSSLIDKLDGDLTKECWKDVPWSDYFDDIRGSEDAPPDDDYHRPNSNCTTRFKAIWDDQHLYIGALLKSDFETKANYHKRNSPIYQKDSDFEVFVDPIGSCHNYKELEVNAINTIWNLMLDRPYDDGGTEHSGRIAKPGDDLYYEVYHQKTATKLLEGELNNNNLGATWSVEIAISYKDIFAHVLLPKQPKPSIGTMWRINFSRVEKEGDINWTWCPQIVWSPNDHRPRGYVAMHLPDAWGYMVFGGEKEEEEQKQKQSELQPRDPSWPARLAALNVYYSQKQYLKDNGNYATNISQLKSYVDEAIISPFTISIDPRHDHDHNNQQKVNDDDYEDNQKNHNDSSDQNKGGGSYLVTVEGNPDGSVVTITDDRYVEVHHESANNGGGDGRTSET